MVGSIQRLPFKTPPGCLRVLVLIRGRPSGGEVLIVTVISRRMVPISMVIDRRRVPISVLVLVRRVVER
jgi:hypothetical protein